VATGGAVFVGEDLPRVNVNRNLTAARLYARCLAMATIAEATFSIAAHWPDSPPLDGLYLTAVLAACAVNALTLLVFVRTVGFVAGPSRPATP
jgi:hypothetical protein